MAHITTTLLTQKEQLDLFALPILTSTERTEYFTFNADEIKVLKSFDDISEALYFAISLSFFKLKHTLVDFTYTWLRVFNVTTGSPGRKFIFYASNTIILSN